MSNIPSREEVKAAIGERKGAYKILVVESQANRILKALWEEYAGAVAFGDGDDRVAELTADAMRAASALYEEKP